MLVGYFVSNSYIKTQYELLNILINYGVDKRAIYYDITNNYVVNKNYFFKMIDELQVNDTVIIIDILNICDNISELLRIINLISNKGSSLKSIKNPWLDTSKNNEYTKYILNILQYFILFVKKRGVKVFWGAFRKTIGLFCLAFGVGVAISILLPVWCWVTVVAIALVALGISWLFC